MDKHLKKYDIFVSYRRDGGYETALPIVEKLRSAGYRVFFDLESMNAGKFNEQLIDVIDGATDFVLVLPERGLDRCQNADDWVRREVTRAMAKGKNIIPVMLKGFVWPDNLPEDMRELPDYQGISASSPEHFDLAIERLKGYLRSTPRRPIRKWLTAGGIAVGALVALAAVAYFTFRQLARPVCTEAGTRITLSMSAMHDMGEIMADFNRVWENYLEQRQRASRLSRPQLDSDMLSDIATSYLPAIEKVRKSYPDFAPLSSYDKFLLGLYGIDPADVDGLRFAVDSQAGQNAEHFDICRIVIMQDLFNQSTRNTFRQGNEAERYGMNMMYYHYLAFMSHLPSDAWDSHRLAAPGWHLYPSVSENLGADEYTRLADLELKKMEKAIEPMSALVEMLTNKNNQLEEYLDEMHHAIDGDAAEVDGADAAAEVPSPEVQEAVERIAKKSEALEQSRRKLSEAEQKLRDQFAGFKTKFAIDGTEDQYIKWGKVCRAASYLTITVQSNSERADQDIEPVITNAEALQYVVDQLDTYQRYHPDTRTYVAAAKAFYAEVASGRRRPEAMIMMGTQHDAAHPLLRTGDIIIERNGVGNLPDFEAYQAAAKKSDPGSIKLLRLDAGHLREIAADFPVTDVHIGLLQLKD